MNILIDIGHPGHVHLFKNYYQIMKNEGHNVLFTTREKECSVALLKAYNLPFENLGKPKKGIVKKLLGLFLFGKKIYQISKKHKIDLYLSVSSMYAAHVSFIRGKKHIVLDDTEHSRFEHMLYKPFSDLLVNPRVFEKDFGKKQIRYDGFHELAYLHPYNFKADSSIFQYLGIDENEAFSIVRFVSWNAGHDLKQVGLSLEQKIEVVKKIAQKSKVFITSEGDLPNELRKYQISIAPERMHDALSFANLYVGEGATMASECAMIGTPAIYINSLDAGTLKAQSEMGLLHSFRDYKGVPNQIESILSDKNSKEKYRQKANIIMRQKVDLSQFLAKLSYSLFDKRASVQNNIKSKQAA
ncbi:MAG: DUF354 domain-containing protein [Bacteroidota bacterium]